MHKCNNTAFIIIFILKGLSNDFGRRIGEGEKEGGWGNQQQNKPAGDDGPILPPFYSTKARTENFLSPENFL